MNKTETKLREEYILLNRATWHLIMFCLSISILGCVISYGIYIEGKTRGYFEGYDDGVEIGKNETLNAIISFVELYPCGQKVWITNGNKEVIVYTPECPGLVSYFKFSNASKEKKRNE